MSFFGDIAKAVGDVVHSDEFQSGLTFATNAVKGHGYANLPHDKIMNRLHCETICFDEDEFQTYKKQLLDSLLLVVDPELKRKTYDVYGVLLFLEMHRFNYRFPRLESAA